MHVEGLNKPEGNLGLRVIRGNRPLLPRWSELGSGFGSMLTTSEIIEHSFPRKSLSQEINAWRAKNTDQGFSRTRRMVRGRRQAQRFGLPFFWSQLWLTKIGPNGLRLPLGLASCRLVTTAGVGFIVDAFQNLVELENMKFHGFGTGGTAEATGDTALVTEETTQYNPDNTRPTGTTTEAAANIYRTVATYSPDSGGTRAITEHGVFSQAATGGGVLLDRSLFSVVNLVAGSDSLEATYELTVSAGG